MSDLVPFRDHLRAHLKLGLPLIGSNVALISVNLTDTLMLGWYGVDELAAVTLAANLFFVLFITAGGFAHAVTSMVAQASEAGDDRQVRRVTRMGLWAVLIASAFLFPVLFFSQPLLISLGQEPALAALAQDYLRIMAFGMVPSLIVMVLKNYLAALERTKVQLWVTILAALMNAVLNYFLIFGHGGLPELSVRGAAIASLTIQMISALILAAYALRHFPQHELFVRFWRPDWEAFREVFHLGWPIGLTSLAEAGLFSATAVIMGMIGTIELAAHGIALEITAIFFMVHAGMSSAATIRAGRALGRGDIVELRRGAAAVLMLSGGYATLAVASFLLIPGPMMAVFIDPADPQRDAIIATGVSLLAVSAIFQLFDAAQVMALGLLRGIRDTRVPMVIAAISYWVIGIPMSYLLGITWGFEGEGVWLGLVLGLVFGGSLLMMRFWRRTSVMRATSA